MYCGGHGNMPFRYPSKERLAPTPVCSSKMMPFPLQPTFMTDGGWGSKSPAILVQCGGTTVMSCGVDQGSGRLHCISDSPANSPFFPSLSQGLSPKALLSKHPACQLPSQSLISREPNQHHEPLSVVPQFSWIHFCA